MSLSASTELPRQLKEAARRVEPLLSEARPERLIASKKTGETVARDSLAALYALAARLHSNQVPFQSKAIETSQQKHVTTDQIWGQMTMLLRPVMRRLQDRVRTAERQYRHSDTDAAHKNANGRGKKGRNTKAATSDDSAGDASEDDHRVDADVDTSAMSESDLDEEIATLLEKQQAKRRSALKSKSAATDEGDKDAWRYAFGRGNGSEDEDEDDGDDDEDGEGHGRRGLDPNRRRRRGDDGDDDDDDMHNLVDDDGDGAKKRGLARQVRDRNARAMMEAEGEAGDDDDEAAADEELAALKEMYGEDFDDDGEGFAGKDDSGVDSDLEALLDEADGAKRHGGSANEDDAYTDADGRYWGKDDMLNDLAGDYEGEDGDPTQAGQSQWQARFGDADDMQAFMADPNADGMTAGVKDVEAYDEAFEQAMQDPSLSAFEKQRLREQKYIKNLEETRLYGTDWTMSGETAASKRPRDALLEVDDLEFEYGMKAVPVVTEAFTAKLEDRIRQRILDGSFDDVTRRTAWSAPEDLHTTRRDAAIDSEKSKMSLMDLYEKEYMDKMQKAEEARGGASTAASAEPLTEIEKDELRAIQMWKRLSQHLDALSNFHFTPKPVQSDLEARVRAVDSQAPAISIETVGNFATTRERALAPQDVYRPASRRMAGVGVDELTPQERRAARSSRKSDGKKKEAIKQAVRSAKKKKSKTAGDLSSVS